MAQINPANRPARSAIAMALLSTCPEPVRVEAAVAILMAVKGPDLCTDVMEAARKIHAHGALLSEFVPMMEREDV
jgi:hypothetical protein